MKVISAFILIAMVISACSVLDTRSDYEQPQYDVVDRIGELVEIRNYGPRLAAEARVESADDSEPATSPFKLLFDYISGGNRARENIAMTSPVERAAATQKIEMTVPVETVTREKNGAYMRFFLPRELNSETVPAPADPRVRIVNVPAQTLAILRFSGLGDDKKVTAKKNEMLNALKDSEWRPVSEPVAYLYDPPWTLPFLRRNEVAVTVVR